MVEGIENRRVLWIIQVFPQIMDRASSVKNIFNCWLKGLHGRDEVH